MLMKKMAAINTKYYRVKEKYRLSSQYILSEKVNLRKYKNGMIKIEIYSNIVMTVN